MSAKTEMVCWLDLGWDAIRGRGVWGEARGGGGTGSRGGGGGGGGRGGRGGAGPTTASLHHSVVIPFLKG
jgi:hypothetical protein